MMARNVTPGWEFWFFRVDFAIKGLELRICNGAFIIGDYSTIPILHLSLFSVSF